MHVPSGNALCVSTPKKNNACLVTLRQQNVHRIFSRCHPLHQDLQHGFPFTRNYSPYILKTSLENVCRGSPHFFRPATLFESQNFFPTTTSGRRKGLCNLFSFGFISRQTQIFDVKSQTPDSPCGPACSAARDTVN